MDNVQAFFRGGSATKAEHVTGRQEACDVRHFKFPRTDASYSQVERGNGASSHEEMRLAILLR